MPAGFTIRVTKPPANGGASMQEFFHVAIDDKNRALEAVRITAKVVNGTSVEVVGELSSIEIGWLSLQPGEVRSVRRTIAGSESQGRATRRRSP